MNPHFTCLYFRKVKKYFKYRLCLCLAPGVLVTIDHQKMNYYRMKKLGRTKEYLPTFHKAEKAIEEIMSLKDSAVTFTSNSRSVLTYN